MKNSIDPYLNIKVDEFKEKHKRLQIEYSNNNEKPKFCSFYEQIQNEDLVFIFGYFHTNLNSLFSFLNSKISVNRHYNAHESRELLDCISEIENLKGNLKDTEWEFQVEKSYEEYIEACNTFLEGSGGSAIPDDFNRILIIESRPVFSLVKTESIETGTNHFAYPLTLIGEGSYSLVYKYKDTFYNRFFAIKRAKSVLNEKEISRFKKEYEVMNSLKSPYVLEVHNFDESKNQYIMEFSDYTLDKFMKNNNTKLELKDRANLVNQVFRAFDYLHSKQILHRDVSYSNILVKCYDALRIIKISDFGLVKEKTSNLTSKNTELKGSLNDPKLELYGFENYDVKFEIYPLTRIIYFIMTGRQVIPTSNKEEANLLAFVKKGVSDNLEERYSSVSEMQKEFKIMISKYNPSNCQKLNL